MSENQDKINGWTEKLSKLIRLIFDKEIEPFHKRIEELENEVKALKESK